MFKKKKKPTHQQLLFFCAAPVLSEKELQAPLGTGDSCLQCRHGVQASNFRCLIFVSVPRLFCTRALETCSYGHLDPALVWSCPPFLSVGSAWLLALRSREIYKHRLRWCQRFLVTLRKLASPRADQDPSPKGKLREVRYSTPVSLSSSVQLLLSFFIFPSCPFLFGLTLVTDDKAAFPAKPINKLNREKMSI